jgi:hypothetical protein
MGNYGCTQYWYNLAYRRYVPRVDITFATMQMMCSFNRDAWDCLESHTERMCIDYDEQGECLEWDEWEMCDRMGLYAASLSCNDSTTYHTLIWDGNGDMPERTTSANVGWLGSAISSILPIVSAARQTSPSTWGVTSQPYTYNGVLCEDWQASSQQYCNYYYTEATGMTWYWQCVRAVVAKPADAPSDATGVKVKVTQTLRAYDGSWGGDPIDPQPVYTETVYTSEMDLTWGTEYYFRTADGLTVSASATACDNGDHSNACVTPCTVDGHSYPWQEITVKIEAIEYIFASSSSSQNGGTGE